VASGDTSCDAKESTLIIEEVKWGNVVTREGGLVLIIDINESRAGEAWEVPL
jgi:hypothetical protein